MEAMSSLDGEIEANKSTNDFNANNTSMKVEGVSWCGEDVEMASQTQDPVFTSCQVGNNNDNPNNNNNDDDNGNVPSSTTSTTMVETVKEGDSGITMEEEGQGLQQASLGHRHTGSHHTMEEEGEGLQQASLGHRHTGTMEEEGEGLQQASLGHRHTGSHHGHDPNLTSPSSKSKPSSSSLVFESASNVLPDQQTPDSRGSNLLTINDDKEVGACASSSSSSSSSLPCCSSSSLPKTSKPKSPVVKSQVKSKADREGSSSKSRAKSDDGESKHEFKELIAYSSKHKPKSKKKIESKKSIKSDDKSVSSCSKTAISNRNSSTSLSKENQSKNKKSKIKSGVSATAISISDSDEDETKTNTNTTNEKRLKVKGICNDKESLLETEEKIKDTTTTEVVRNVVEDNVVKVKQHKKKKKKKKKCESLKEKKKNKKCTGSDVLVEQSNEESKSKDDNDDDTLEDEESHVEGVNDISLSSLTSSSSSYSSSTSDNNDDDDGQDDSNGEKEEGLETTTTTTNPTRTSESLFRRRRRRQQQQQQRVRRWHPDLSTKSDDDSSSSSSSSSSGEEAGSGEDNNNDNDDNMMDEDDNDSDDSSESELEYNVTGLGAAGDSDSINDDGEIGRVVDEILSKPRPLPNWFAVPELQRREYGYSLDGRCSSMLFNERVQGSVEMARRLKLSQALKYHDGCVNSLCFNRIGTLLASGSDDLSVVLWNWEKGRPSLVYDSGHRGNVFQAKFMPYSGDCHVVSCSRDGQVRLAELSLTGVCKSTRKLAQHRGSAHKLALEYDSANVFLSCGEDALTYLFDLRDERPHRLVTTKEREKKVPLYSIHSNPSDSNQFCVGGRDEYIRIYDKRKIAEDVNGGVMKKLCPHHLVDSKSKANVTCAVYNYNGTEILGSYNDEDIYLFDNQHSDGADYVHKYQGHRNNATVKGVNFYGPRSEFVVSGSDCGNLFVWEKQSEAIVTFLEGDKAGVINVLEPHPVLPVLATSGLDHEVKLWTPNQSDPQLDRPKLKKTIHTNHRERKLESVSEPNGISGQMMWMIMHHFRNTARRRLREEGLELSSSSGGEEGDGRRDSDNSDNEADQEANECITS